MTDNATPPAIDLPIEDPATFEAVADLLEGLGHAELNIAASPHKKLLAALRDKAGSIRDERIALQMLDTVDKAAEALYNSFDIDLLVDATRPFEDFDALERRSWRIAVIDSLRSVGALDITPEQIEIIVGADPADGDAPDESPDETVGEPVDEDADEDSGHDTAQDGPQGQESEESAPDTVTGTAQDTADSAPWDEESAAAPETDPGTAATDAETDETAAVAAGPEADSPRVDPAHLEPASPAVPLAGNPFADQIEKKPSNTLWPAGLPPLTSIPVNDPYA